MRVRHVPDTPGVSAIARMEHPSSEYRGRYREANMPKNDPIDKSRGQGGPDDGGT